MSNAAEQTARFDEDVADVVEEQRPAAGSMAERAAARRQQLTEHNTEVFDVPGYIGILQVEYRALDYPELRKISSRHQRVRDEAEQELLVAVDTLMAASINSYEVLPGGKTRELSLPWGTQLARELGIEGNFDRARQAVFACFPQSTWLTQHYTEYTDWLRGIGIQVDDEQAEEFETDPR